MYNKKPREGKQMELRMKKRENQGRHNPEMSMQL